LDANIREELDARQVEAKLHELSIQISCLIGFELVLLLFPHFSIELIVMEEVSGAEVIEDLKDYGPGGYFHQMVLVSAQRDGLLEQWESSQIFQLGVEEADLGGLVEVEP
jgi:hypothetical protein